MAFIQGEQSDSCTTSKPGVYGMPRAEGLGHREGRLELERGGTGVTTPAEVVRRGVFPDAVMRPEKRMACARSRIARASGRVKWRLVGFEPTTSPVQGCSPNHWATQSDAELGSFSILGPESTAAGKKRGVSFVFFPGMLSHFRWFLCEKSQLHGQIRSLTIKISAGWDSNPRPLGCRPSIM